MGLYEALAERLNIDGIAMHALDAIGHGHSDGERDLMESWDWYCGRRPHLANLALAQHPGRPLVLMGPRAAPSPPCSWPSGPPNWPRRS